MDVQTVTVVIAGISVIVGVINSILSSRRAEKNDQQMLETRQAQLFMQVYNRWASRDMIRSYGLTRFIHTDWNNFDELWALVRPDVDLDTYAEHMTIHYFYEGLGVLVKKGLIDVSLVEDLFAQRIIWHFERYESAMIEARLRTGDPLQFDSIEYLYKILKQRAQQTTVST